MKDLYEKYFYVPKHGKVKERVMLARIAVSVVIMLVLMAGMSLSAYAYFTANNTTMIKPIKAAHYQLDTVVIAPDDLTPDNAGVYTLENPADGNGAENFVFKIRINETTNATVGFCEIVVKTDASDDVQKFYTEPIGKYVIADQSVEVKERSVTIRVPEGKKAEVRFVSQWGTCGSGLVLATDAQNASLLFDQVQYAQSASVDSGNSTDNANGQFSFSSDSSSTDGEVVTQDANTPVDQGTGNAGNE